ncbi:MAG: hypothetical protein M1819_005001 [Sarea resinae]|nr:MAG: hypothetical protein M1819_005001 [Sarea resinae]
MMLARRAASKAPQQAIRQCCARRFASSEHGHGGHGHAEPVNESLGAGFFIALSALPFSYLVYKISRPSSEGEKPLLTRVIESYSEYKEKWIARNTLHTSMIEQAAFDRNLFQSGNRDGKVELKFPEIFNTGSPYNVPAGHGGANIDKAIAHYEAANAAEEERKHKSLAEGTTEQRQYTPPITRL